MKPMIAHILDQDIREKHADSIEKNRRSDKNR